MTEATNPESNPVEEYADLLFSKWEKSLSPNIVLHEVNRGEIIQNQDGSFRLQPVSVQFSIIDKSLLYNNVFNVEPDGATMIVVVDRQVLLVSEPRIATGMHEFLALPGGSVDMGEFPIDTARRETLEETGVDLEGVELTRLTPLGGVLNHPGASTRRSHIFLAEISREQFEQSGIAINSDEISDCKLVPLRQARQVCQESISMIGLQEYSVFVLDRVFKMFK